MSPGKTPLTRVKMNTTSGNKPMEVLVTELAVLLKLLDQETLSSPTQEKKTSVRNLLQQIQPSDCDLGELKDMTEDQKLDQDTHTEETTPTHTQETTTPTHTEDTTTTQSRPDPRTPRDETPPPLPTTPPPEEGYYEEAAPLSPGTAPEYITTRGRSSPPNSIEDNYEDAESSYPPARRKNSYNDSDALSSSYESYDEEEEEKPPGNGEEEEERAPGHGGEEEEERAPGHGVTLTHQWPSEESSMGAVRDCHICAFLLRKKRFGQWAKQLTVIKDNRLQCFKSSKDVSPYVDLSLPQCIVVYAPKEGKRKRHELRFTPPSGDAVVLAVQSEEQAHRWLRVVREVTGQSKAPEEPASPVIPRKTELDTRLSGEKNVSDSDSVGVSPGEGARENGKVKRGALAAGRKITRIISFSKKKPPRPGEARPPLSDLDPRQGYLAVLVSQVWREQWCCVWGGSLHFYPDRASGPRPSLPSVALHGCEVQPGLGFKHPFALRILRGGQEVAALEAGRSEELGRWLGVLLAETGSSTDPESLHYDYVDVETIANIRNAARHSFLWATSSSSSAVDSRTYDEVPYEGKQPEDHSRPKPGAQVKRRSSFSSSDSGRTEAAESLKRTGSNGNRYGRYGKTRAEEDARRYHGEKEELERQRGGVQQALVTLRQERRELREELKTASERQRPMLSERVAQLDEACRGKEAERVDLELQLTQVKDNLKKSLAGGALGAPEEAKPPSKARPSKGQNLYSESVPVYCVSDPRKRTPAIYASSTGTVMQKAKEWESKKRT